MQIRPKKIVSKKNLKITWFLPQFFVSIFSDTFGFYKFLNIFYSIVVDYSDLHK